MRQDLSSLEAKLQEHQQIFQDNPFDTFLEAELGGLSRDQLAYLWHFADKGYFTVQREILLRLLEDRLEHHGEATPTAATIADRAKNLALKYEQRLRDLKTAVELYEKTQQGDFHVPTTLTDDQMAVLRDLVAEKLVAAKKQAAELDEKIATANERIQNSSGP